MSGEQIVGVVGIIFLALFFLGMHIKKKDDPGVYRYRHGWVMDLSITAWILFSYMYKGVLIMGLNSQFYFIGTAAFVAFVAMCIFIGIFTKQISSYRPKPGIHAMLDRILLPVLFVVTAAIDIMAPVFAYTI